MGTLLIDWQIGNGFGDVVEGVKMRGDVVYLCIIR